MQFATAQDEFSHTSLSSWTAGLRPCVVYYEWFVTDLEGLLQKHRLDTVSTFSIHMSCQTVAGKQQAKMELDNQNQVNHEYSKIIVAI